MCHDTRMVMNKYEIAVINFIDFINFIKRNGDFENGCFIAHVFYETDR